MTKIAASGRLGQLEPHRDLRDALLGRMLDAARADLEPGRPIDEVFDELRRDMAKPRPEPARWEKSAR
jgi:antitoxin ParD1/3/4